MLQILREEVSQRLPSNLPRAIIYINLLISLGRGEIGFDFKDYGFIAEQC